MNRYTAKKKDLSKDRAPISLRQTLKIARENCGYSTEHIALEADKKGIRYFGGMEGLSNQNISDLEKGKTGLRHRVLEKLSVIYEIPAGVLLIVSRAVAETKRGDKQKLESLIFGLEGLIESLKLQIKDMDENPCNYPIEDFVKSDKFTEAYISAYKKSGGLHGIGPDFLKRVEDNPKTSN